MRLQSNKTWKSFRGLNGLVTANSQISHFLKLTVLYRLVDDIEAIVRIAAQINVVVEPQFLRVLRVGQVQKQWYHPIRHGSLCQGLMHHVTAPIILHKAGSDEQSPNVAILQRPAKLSAYSTSWTGVSVPQEAPEAAWRVLKERDQTSGFINVSLGRTVTYKHVIFSFPSQL